MTTDPQFVSETIAPKDDQNARYLITIVSFSVLAFLAGLIFYFRDGVVPTTIEPWEFVLLGLASFRLIRLFTYDQVMRVVRDWFLITEEKVGEDGVTYLVRKKPLNGGRRSLSDLFSCPWCMGMWVSYFVVFFYFLFPAMRYLVLILALAGVASAIQIVMNGIGAKAEFFKRENNLHN